MSRTTTWEDPRKARQGADLLAPQTASTVQSLQSTTTGEYRSPLFMLTLYEFRSDLRRIRSKQRFVTLNVRKTRDIAFIQRYYTRTIKLGNRRLLIHDFRTKFIWESTCESSNNGSATFQRLNVYDKKVAIFFSYRKKQTLSRKVP